MFDNEVFALEMLRNSNHVTCLSPGSCKNEVWKRGIKIKENTEGTKCNPCVDSKATTSAASEKEKKK